MKFSINEKIEQPLLSRLIVKGTVEEYNATPSKQEVRKLISGAVKVPEDQIVVSSIFGKFGKSIATVEAHVYHDAKALQIAELKPGKKALEKLKGKEAKKEEAAEKPKEVVAEKPVEEKKEEHKAKEKPQEKKE